MTNATLVREDKKKLIKIFSLSTVFKFHARALSDFRNRPAHFHPFLTSRFAISCEDFCRMQKKRKFNGKLKKTLPKLNEKEQNAATECWQIFRKMQKLINQFEIIKFRFSVDFFMSLSFCTKFSNFTFESF